MLSISGSALAVSVDAAIKIAAAKVIFFIILSLINGNPWRQRRLKNDRRSIRAEFITA